jgi:hypothetical protein
MSTIRPYNPQLDSPCSCRRETKTGCFRQDGACSCRQNGHLCGLPCAQCLEPPPNPQNMTGGCSDTVRGRAAAERAAMERQPIRNTGSDKHYAQLSSVVHCWYRCNNHQPQQKSSSSLTQQN